MGGNLFWGLLLIIIGFTLIIKVIFHIDIPVFKVFIAFFFIYIGVKLLLGNFSFGFNNPNKADTVFGEKQFIFSKDQPKEQNIVFGKATINFDSVSENQLPAKYHLSTVFGAGDILINRNIPIKINIDAAFAGVELPNGNTSAFGSSFYQTPAFDESKPYLFVKIDAVFSGIKLIIY